MVNLEEDEITPELIDEKYDAEELEEIVKRFMSYQKFGKMPTVK